MLLGTIVVKHLSVSHQSFNPQRGFMLLGTSNETMLKRRTREFQSPERIHAFGNLWRSNDRESFYRFNPQRGFMLLGTAATFVHSIGVTAFQSPERIHAFGNVGKLGHLTIHRFQSPERIHAFGNATRNTSQTITQIVSIPREDSCFWERP